MSRLSSSIDIGAELDSTVNPPEKKPSRSVQHESGGQGNPNVRLGWQSDGSHQGNGQLCQDNSQSHHEKGKYPRVAQSKQKKILLASIILIAIMILSWYRFTSTDDFPGIEKAVDKQMQEALRTEVSQQITSDYKSVSEARKRYMFNQKFDEVRKSPEFKQIVKNKQEAAKDMFRDAYGMPYLYAPEAYRFAQAAGVKLGRVDSNNNMRLSKDDLRAGRAIAAFHQYTGMIRPSESIDWSTFYFPAAIGLIVVVMTCLTAFLITDDPSAVLFTGLALSIHPLIASTFSAGLPHPSIIFLAPLLTGIAVLSIIVWLKGWWLILPVAAATLAGVGVYSFGLPAYDSLRLQTVMMGRGLAILALISLAGAIWCMVKRQKTTRALQSAAVIFALAVISSNADQSAMLTLISAGALIGVGASAAFQAGAKSFSKTVMIIFLAIVIAGSSYIAAGSTQGIILPGVDDSTSNASVAIKLDSKSKGIFLTDPVTSDPVAYISGLMPAIGNRTDPGNLSLFAKAMISNDENESKTILKSLMCTEAGSAGSKTGCPDQRYLLITDRTFSMLTEYAKQVGIDLQDQRFTMPAQCDIKSKGGIQCVNGFEVLDLNATIQGSFPTRMVSFIGKKTIAQYKNNKMQEAFIIYRENGKLYSMIVPDALAESFLVRAMGHDEIPFLEELSSFENPTHTIVYKIENFE